jgi:hypothetical protein
MESGQVTPQRRAKGAHVDDATVRGLFAAAVPGHALGSRVIDCDDRRRQHFPLASVLAHVGFAFRATPGVGAR